MDSAGARPALRVLIVDDNRDAADSVALLLNLGALLGAAPGTRYDVRVAYDAGEALREARAFVPDCLVSDIQMPGMDGYALARAVRREPALAAVKLVALSAFADDEHARLATEAGFDYRLTKARDIRELVEILGMIEAIKELAERTRELSERNVDLAGQTKDLIEEVKDDVRSLKEDVAELKRDVKELKENGGPGETEPS